MASHSDRPSRDGNQAWSHTSGKLYHVFKVSFITDVQMYLSMDKVYSIMSDLASDNQKAQTGLKQRISRNLKII